MQQPLTAFPIMEFKTGIHTYLEPWIRPVDAFQPLKNAYIYRGTVNKRAGYTQYGNTLGDGQPVMGIMRRIEESTGVISLVVASMRHLYLYVAGTNTFNLIATSPLFSGTIRNFFNWTNWQATTGATAYLWLTNGIDAVTNFDGAVASQPAIVINGAGTTITTELDVVVYKQLLLLVRPTLSLGGVQNQSIYWSAIQNPSLWRVDIAGQGGNLDAPTGDIIQSTEFIRDVLVVFFTNSTWIFRYTGNDSQPFRWDKVNNTKSTNAPYGSIAYDERCTSIGNTGFIACDGVNVQRYDVPIIDYYETNFSELYYSQAFSQRYENLNQSWTMYVSQDRDPLNFPLVGNIAPGSDQALVYNFLENTWATYTWTRPMTCMGIYFNQSGKTWADLNASPQNEWENEDLPWDSYTNQSAAPILLAGDTTGHVWYMDNGNSVTDSGDSIVPDIVSTRWNPIIQAGIKLQFCYIDIYYKVVSVNPNNPIAVTLNFYVNNSSQVTTSRTLTLDGPSQNTNGTIGIGDGTSSFSGTILSDGYIVPLTLEIVATTSAGIESFSDDGFGILTGTLGDVGTINYETFVWTLTLSGRTIPVGNPITTSYSFNEPNTSNFKRIYINLIGEFVQMEIDPNVDSFMQFIGFILWVSPAGRLTSP